MRAAITIRVSTKKEEQEASLVHQRQFFENYVKEKGWDVYGFYVEIESGTKKNRKEMNRLIADAKEHKFDIILSKELSRLARNQGLAFEIKEVIEKHKIHLITMDGAIDTTTGNTNNFGLFAWLYEQESQRTSERIKMALATRADNGKFKGSNSPYGYNVQDGKLYISDDGSPQIVQRIFQRYLDGKGFDAIARELYEDDVKTPSSQAGKVTQSIFWHGSSVRKILENPHYCGDLVQGRSSTVSVTSTQRHKNPKTEHIVKEKTHEAIISKDVFDSVQQMIAFNRKKKSQSNPNVSSRPHENVHLFTGVIYCADCGSGFHYQQNGHGYICGRSNKHGNKACSKHRIKEATLKTIIQGDLQKLANAMKDDSHFNLVKDRLNKERVRMEKDLKACGAKLEAINQLKNKALTRFLEDIITKVDYDNFVTSKDAETKELMLNREIAETTLSTTIASDVLAKIKEVIDNALNFNDVNREVISRFIEKIEVKEDGTVKLYYRFAGTSKILNELIG
ncbi:Site-specific DNA recombinase [Paenibacillus sp. 1_12]|uniref:recombinase family protein n=1 Tax=Paenibacillus sp. 1_12 TaxID=1566278 RepID=UPI0008E818D8|nr:recombinase family protein [Paenibacillus sp. 1_12]SFL21026.1 Site-specific DNA recombinase [Paenibacillus sp. 1_12]